jgi:hypothetical protein
VTALRGTGTPRREIFGYFPHYTPATGAIPASWVRRGDWKLLRFHADGENGADRFELYNLRDDVGETTNLASRQPEMVREMNTLITGFLNDTGAVVPLPNPAYRKGAGPAAPGGNGAAVAGWRSAHDCSLAVRNGALAITSTGADPYLTASLPRLPVLPAGEYSITLRLKSSASGGAQVFWQEQGVTPRFIRARSVEFTPAHDGKWKEYTVRIRAGRPLTGLRLDPAQGAGEIDVSSIFLTDATGKAVREWRF